MAKKDEFEFNIKSKREKKEKPEKPSKEKEPKLSLSDDGDFNFDKQIKREKAKKEPKERKLKDDEGSFEIGGKRKSEKAFKEPKERKIKLSEDDISLNEGSGKKPFSHYLNTFLWGKNYAELDNAGKKKKWYRPTVIIASLILVIVAIVAVVFAILPNGEVGEYGIKNIQILSQPEKTEYYVGDEPTYSGLKVLVTFNNASTMILGPNDCEITGFDSSEPASDQQITVKYQGFSTAFTIVIKERVEVPTGMYNGLSFKTLPKTEYKVGEWLDCTGGVLLRHYDDGTTIELELEDKYVYGFKTLEPGTYTVSVKYVEQGYLASTTFTITVTE